MLYSVVGRVWCMNELDANCFGLEKKCDSLRFFFTVAQYIKLISAWWLAKELMNVIWIDLFSLHSNLKNKIHFEIKLCVIYSMPISVWLIYLKDYLSKWHNDELTCWQFFTLDISKNINFWRNSYELCVFKI